MRKYPMLVVDNIEDGTRFKLLLNDKFPHIHFYIRRYGSLFRVDPVLEEDLSPEEYLDVFLYAQQIFSDY